MSFFSRRHLTFPLVLAVLALVAGFVVTSTASAQGATCFGRAATIIASPGTTTVGTRGADVIVGSSGNDIIRGKGGADLICSGGGDDRVYGGFGADRIDLGPGQDFARGGPGRDTIEGGEGRDLIRGRSGRDTIYGEGGIDTCYGGKGRDTLYSCNEVEAAPPSEPAPPAEPEPEPELPSTQGLSSQEALMVDLVQDLRSRNGAGPVQVSLDMSEVARDWSHHLPNGFYHNPQVGNQIPDGWWMWGENIAYNASIEAAFNALVNSSGHFRNMVNPDFTHIGVGVYVEGGRVYVTQVFARY